MAKEQTSYHKFLLINKIMRDDHRMRIVEDVLSKRANLTKKIKERIKASINDLVSIPGFRKDKTYNAELRLLTSHVSEAFKSQNEIAGAILQAWQECNKELNQVTTTYIDQKKGFTKHDINWHVGFRSDWTSGEMENAAREIIENNSSFDYDDVCLMLCLRSGYLPIDPNTQYEFDAPQQQIHEDRITQSLDKNPDPKTSLPDKWDSIIELFGKLPADAPLWDHLDEFITDLKMLAAEKINTRLIHNTKVEKLIQEIKEQAFKVLRYFEFTGIDTWDPGCLTSKEAEDLADVLEKFKEQLLSYQDLENKETLTYPETKAKRQELEILEANLQASYAQLQLGFSGDAKLINSQEGSQPVNLPTSSQKSEVDQEINKNILVDLNTASTMNEKKEVFPDVPAAPISAETPQKPSWKKSNFEQEFTEEKNEHSKGTGDDTEVPSYGTNCQLQEQPSLIDFAKNILSDEKTEDWHNFVWSLIFQWDIPAAYWLVRSKEEKGDKHAIPSWLLEAMHGSNRLENEYQSIVSNLLDLSSKEISEARDNPSVAILQVAVSIKPAIIAPYSGLTAWLGKLGVGEAIDNVISAALKFTENGITLHLEDIDVVAGESLRDNTILDVVRNAQEWLTQSPSRKFKILRASAVWRYLVKPGGDLHSIITAVSEDKRSELDNIQSQVGQWRQKYYILDRIEKIDVQLNKLKPRPIMGSARGQLESHIEEACEIASQWCHYVRHEKEIASRGNWIFSQITNFQLELKKNLQPSIDELAELSTPAQRVDVRAAAQYMKQVLINLAAMMKIDVKIENTSRNDQIILKKQPTNIVDDLRQYLILFPDIDLQENLEPVSLDGFATSVAKHYTTPNTIRTIFDRHLQKQDYRFIRMFEGLITEDPITLAREHIGSSQGHLRNLKLKVQNEIEQGMVDGIISDIERAEFNDLIEQIDPETTLNFNHSYKVLNKINLEVSEAKTNRLKDLRGIWDDLNPDIQNSASITPDNKTKIIDAVERSIQQFDTRLLEEYIARIKSALDEYKDWEDSSDIESSDANTLDEFIRSHPIIETSLTTSRIENVAKQIKEGSYRDGRSFRTIPAPRREEAEQAIKAWRQLKNLKNDRKSLSSKNNLVILLKYLGFGFDVKVNDPIQFGATGEDSIIAKIAMSDLEQAKPIHHFGSRADGKYQVICLWERPEKETIASRIRQYNLKNDNVIILYLGRLGLKQRDSLIKLNYEEKFNLIVLDEILLIYLAQERDSRLNTFFRCAVPFSAINPYTPFQAGDVPPEMFYGRREMIHNLHQQTGSCIIYGGRQLGKSALLKQVEREFHNPSRDQFAKVLDIKLIGNHETKTPTDDLWKKIRLAFKELGLFSQDVRSDKPDEIDKNIRKALSDNKQRRVLILFDEADNFLDADASQNFKITERLRTIMVETNRRFKIVFAGLHNVQRFQSNPNQPLAHFGTPLLIGPLDAKSAISLIKEPMYFLGYRFDDITGPLRILSFTNYHPGLIQLFCQELLERLRGNKPSKLPPYDITQNDIEVVYRQVKDKIKERFDWTLALDPSYQGIAWSMIYDQIAIRDSYSHTYSPSDLLMKVRSLLPKRFDNITLDNFTGLLHEMKGLGVLARDNNGSYRLRSPNVVRLAGSEKEIETRLLELMENSPLVRSSDHFHSLIEKGLYNPFNYQQERRLNAFEAGVLLLFGGSTLFNLKNGTGFTIIPYFLEKLFASNEPNDSVNQFINVPLFESSGDLLRSYLDKTIKKDKARVYVYYSMESSSLEEMVSLINVALIHVDSMKRYKNSQIIRYFFGFNPKALKVWLGLNQTQRKNIENRADVFSPQSWTIDGISHRLEIEGMIHPVEICRKILDVTGGNYLLINKIFEYLATRHGGTKDDPRDEVEKLDIELTNKTPALITNIIEDIGINDFPLSSHILKYIITNGSEAVPLDYITPELISYNAESTMTHYQAALDYLIMLNCISKETDSDENKVIAVNPIIKKVY